MKNVIVTLLLSVFLFSSCMVTKTNVGAFKEIQGKTYHYSSTRQAWLFWGVFPLGRANAETPKDGDCQIKTHYDFWDFITTLLTVGIVKTYSIDVYAKRVENTINQ